MGWDSNPRDAQTPAGFQDQCLQPLGHPSMLIAQRRFKAVQKTLALPIFFDSTQTRKRQRLILYGK